jgi:nucleosome binding factor SPN SPT16 subunit
MKLHFQKEMETALDEDKPVQHSKLADTIEDVFNNAAALAKVRALH